MLFDEPLANLDVHLKTELEDEILALQRRLEMTNLYITHDPKEAFYMGERIAIMQAGQLVRIGTQHEIIERPTSPFVAQLVDYWRVSGPKRTGSV